MLNELFVHLDFNSFVCVMCKFFEQINMDRWMEDSSPWQLPGLPGSCGETCLMDFGHYKAEQSEWTDNLNRETTMGRINMWWIGLQLQDDK